jgi:hypothetical protein
MNNFTKEAYEAGAQQALVDAGLAKQAGVFTPTSEKRLARQLVEGGWAGRAGGVLAQQAGLGLGGGLGYAAAAQQAGQVPAQALMAGALGGTQIGGPAGKALGLVGGAGRGNRIAAAMLEGKGNHYASTGLSEARRRAVAGAVLAESGTRKAVRQAAKAVLTTAGVGGALALAATPMVPAIPGLLASVAGVGAGGYAGHRAAHALVPVRVAEATRLERLRGALSHGLKGPGGKATALAALLGAGALGYNALSDD